MYSYSPVPDRVHAAVDHMQSTGVDAITDSPPAKAQVGQLLPGHDAVLSARQLRYFPVTWRTFDPIYGLK